MVADKDQTPLSIAEAEEVDIRVLMYVNRCTIGKMVELSSSPLSSPSMLFCPKGIRVLIPTDLEKGAQELSEDERSSEEESQDDGSIDGERTTARKIGYQFTTPKMTRRLNTLL